ncbi:hypothetical protein S7711_11311 [Stachybotrys chartarum IBT 7711]|uniref:Uncharacterized protein n=1 Tax=Stachybotrys chartarum (strain CBS 109288 / IBT 7711) TaxID=1280523 RepID=A0A084AIU7_STACB|nr:hypothetical protein S7711_11311 [Stachybotrys chartarum IBT 7711]
MQMENVNSACWTPGSSAIPDNVRDTLPPSTSYKTLRQSWVTLDRSSGDSSSALQGVFKGAEGAASAASEYNGDQSWHCVDLAVGAMFVTRAMA